MPEIDDTAFAYQQELLKLLSDKGVLNTNDVTKAQRLSQENSTGLPRTLVKLGWVSEQDMAIALVEYSNFPLADDSDYPTSRVASPHISTRFMKNYQLIPVVDAEDKLAIIMADPSDKNALDSLRFLCGSLPAIKIGLPSKIDYATEEIYGEESDKAGEKGDFDSEPSEDDIEYLKDLASEAPIIQLVNKVIQKAVDTGASDIHIEPFDSALDIRYRIDGVLTKERAPPGYSTAAVISRIKIMAKLDIAERRLPQDGRIMVRSQGKTLDIRVSTLPTVHGESVVMRILDRENLSLNFDTLGFTPEILTGFLDVLAVPNGIILVTGPTGSGKSTTLYTAISHLNTPEVKIITVEDPVEYQLEGINQLPVKSSIGLDFATALRSIVRQDPDIIMIGEMRDVETAKIAIQSALTGHLVLSTLHTNSAAAGITRLLDMGVENYLLLSTINGILGQRLVRKLCPSCCEASEPSAEQLRIMDVSLEKVPKIYAPKGCELCNYSGYSGRTMLVEWLPISEGLQTLIMKNAGANAIQQKATEEGMKTIFQDGIEKVIAGITSIDEVLRVSQQEN